MSLAYATCSEPKVSARIWPQVSAKALPKVSIDLPRPEHGHLWAIVLVGGEGTRWKAQSSVAPLDEVSPLRRTLDQVALLVPKERTVVVTFAGQARALAPELARLEALHVLAQPSDRGTAAGVLLPAHFIHARDPEARVVVFPTDHFMAEEAAFMRHVAAAAGYARAHPEWLLLLGVEAEGPESAHGWIEPGECIGSIEQGPLHRVRTVWENPSDDIAQSLFARGSLWNTFVFASSVTALIDAGLRCLPLLHDRLVRLGVFVGTPFQTWAIEQAYRLAPRADFSRAVLESSLRSLAVMRVPACHHDMPGRRVAPPGSFGLDA